MKTRPIRSGTLPWILIIGGLIGAGILLVTGPEPEQRAIVDEGIPVHIVTAKQGTHRTMVTGMGTVQPDREVSLHPEISGRVIEVNEDLRPGGRIAAGTVLLHIDPRDYHLAVAQREADVARVLSELDLEAGRRRVAEREWDLLKDDIQTSDAGRRLALREPQNQSLHAALEAAKSRLEKARLDLERTELRAPFNAIIQREAVDIGQNVTPQTELARLIGSDRFRVQVSVPVEHLPWIRFPDGDEPGSKVKIFYETGRDQETQRTGRVTRLLGDLDPVGRLARVLTVVDHPLRVRDDTPPLPLFVGAYVRVEIEGTEIYKATPLPRTALRQDDKIWIMTADDTLEIRPVHLVWRGGDTLYLNEGISDGERIIVSNIAVPLPGLKLRLHESSTGRMQQADDVEAPL